MPLTMRISLIPKLAIIAFLFIITSAWPSFSNFNQTTITCNEEDREGLIKFKQTLQDPHNLLSSWKNGEDCCKWKGVTCHKVTGRVTKLELQSITVLDDDDWIGSDSFLYSESSKSCIPLGVGELSSGLASLRYMSHLDLSGIWYTNITVVPPFFGSMKRLRHLHLEGDPSLLKHGCYFDFLDLQFSPFTSVFSRLVVDDVSWLSHLQSLESLEMGNIQLQKPHEFMEVINNNLSSLSHLRLSHCQLEKSHVSHLNSTFLHRLQYLNLSSNNLDGPIPSAFRNITSLQHLDLSKNSLDGQISNAFGNTPSLQYLDLSSNNLDGQISNAFRNITSLQYLDLSKNNLNGQISNAFGNTTSLQYLNLSSNNLHGQISNAFRNITSLQYLDLSRNSFNSQLIVDVFVTLLKNNQNLKSLRASCSYEPQKPQQTGFPFHYNYSAGSIGGNLELLQLDGCMLSGPLPIFFQEMKRLKYLLLEGNFFQCSIPSLPNLKVIDLSYNGLDVVNITSLTRLPSLESLYLSGNTLKGDILESLSVVRNLRKLDVSDNQLNGTIPSSISRLSALESIDLWNNNLEGSIPKSLGTLPNLTKVDLSSNRLDGMIPSSFGQLSTLQFLDLSYNRLNGTIPINFGQLSNLVELVLSDNSLEGTISESHFANLSKLKFLVLGQNNLTFKVSSNWVPPFQLLFIELGSCKIETEFPRWIQTQRVSKTLILSNARINGPIPKWLGDMQLSGLDLSHNSFVEMPKFSSLFLVYLDLSNNLISDHLPLNISEMMPNLMTLFLHNNSISGTLPLSLCDIEYLSHLDLSKNNISGSIPDCWRNTSSLHLINFSSNKFSGIIPKSFVSIPYLQFLHLNNNNLSGRFPFPKSLGQWSKLTILDIGQNSLSGNLSSSVVMSTDLRILRLRGNEFDGTIPWNFCSLHSLQILDLAVNNLIGSIPSCFAHLNGMKKGGDIFDTTLPFGNFDGYSIWKVEGVLEIMRGIEIEFTTNTKFLVYLDLSRNHLIGSIPEKLVSLSGLIGLNLSHNNLSGNIPRNIENLMLLESLDLSNNQLSGQIPHGISSLTALSRLNLANNSLSGHIPQGTQISTIYDENPSIFNGNPYLCGDPLPQKCKVDGAEPPQASKSTTTMGKEEYMSDEFILYVLAALGYAIGFWGIILVLIFKKNWRIACFMYVDEIANKVYVAILVKLAKFHCR